jgi:hypothetical protein
LAIDLCKVDGCLLEKGHRGKHNKYPINVWEDSFFQKDIDKVSKAGYATPRGGGKNAYQNHVYRNNQVIIPYEKLSSVNLQNYKDGYVIRLFPKQYFENAGQVKNEFLSENSLAQVGVNAFILYRTHEDYRDFPPLNNWTVRHLENDGYTVTRRSKSVVDAGHYVLRLHSISTNHQTIEGPPQGIFAPEYADEKTNYLSKAFLAWLIIKTQNSPYDENNFEHLKAILEFHNLNNIVTLEQKSILKNGLTCCPLCTKTIEYNQLHEMLSFNGASGLANSQEQVEGATRSTAVNLFHMMPLVYESLEHKPDQLSWGHAICNTRLGQRECIPLNTIQEHGKKIAIIDSSEKPTDTIGYISNDKQFIRSDNGDVWIKITDINDDDSDD